MSNLLVTGSIAIDRIAVFRDRFANHILPEKVHRLNVAFAVKDMTENFGGTGGNIAYNLSLLGEQPILLGAVGSDGRKYITHLKKRKINCDYIYKSKDKLTAHATVMTDMDDNQITAFYEGAMALARNSQCPMTNVQLGIVAPNDINAMLQYADEFKKSKVRFIADPGQSIPALSAKELRQLITGAHVLICNDYEWALIQEKTGWGLKEVLLKTDYLIVTYGEEGAKIWSRDDASVIDVPAIKPKGLVDPTGCGDAYRAGLMYGIGNAYPIEKSAHIGAWLAARAIEKRGTQNHKIKKSELKKFLFKLQKQ
jgi:adenosine kinase